MRQHSSDEFGKTGLGSAAAMGDRGSGAAPGVIVDGIVEREAGLTPGPFASSRTLAVVLGAMLLVALSVLGILTLMARPEPLPAGVHRSIWVGLAAYRPATAHARFEFMSEPDENDRVTVWSARPDKQAVYLIDGREVGVSEFVEYLQRGMWPADVTASTAGIFVRVEILTPGVSSDS